MQSFIFRILRPSVRSQGLILGIGLFIITGCQPGRTRPQPTSDSRYDTEVVTEGIGPLLEATSKSIIRINYIGTYAIYTVPLESRITRDQSSALEHILNMPTDTYENQTSSGTGILLKSTKDRITVLTCAHIGNYPDTVFSYLSADDKEGSFPIEAIALRIKEKYYTSNLKGIAVLNPTKVDLEKDLMLLEAYRESVDFPEPPINIPNGNSSALQWGSRVFILGFPMGNLMVTDGMVSAPDPDSPYLLMDALFNPGFSGGLVMAVRDGLPHLEWIGIAKSVSARSMVFLKPDPGSNTTGDVPYTSYTGQPYIGTHQDINYGVTFAIPIETIQQFLTGSADDESTPIIMRSIIPKKRKDS
ncbi:MAG: trypsin-like peptidase domain-containing protein [FCB group bacterium]|nr:trypsin-like peptidase domain-containing protein [FCB group bacterium]